jgi:hypothetical protein
VLETIGKIAAVWGESADKIEEVVARVKEGTASEQDMLHLASQISPELQKQVQAYRDMITQAPYVERAMQRNQTLVNRQFEDQKRLTDARNAYFDKTGLAEKVFGEQIKGPYANYDKEQLRSMADTFQNRQNLLKQFREGIKQLSTETGLRPDMLRGYIDAGIYGTKDLLEASTRYRDQQKRTADRAFEDQRMAIEQGKDETKLNLLQQERDALFDQVKAQATLNVLTSQFNAEQKTIVGQGQAIAREVQSAQENAGKTADHVKGWVDKAAEAMPLKDRWGGLQPWEVPKPPSEPAPWDTEAWINRRTGGAAVPGGGGEKTVPILQQIESLLRLVFGIPTSP